MILVTGGTGLVGSHLLYELLKKNERIKAIYRRAHTLERVKTVFAYYAENASELYHRIEWIEADLNDVPALQDAFKGVTQVYHCAALVSFEPNKYNQLRKVNIQGTANIVNLCISNKVEKLCYVSSIAALGHTPHPDTLITESTEWNPELDHSVYAITKYGAELEIWRGTQEGVAAVIVNPGIILGPGFWNGGGSGSLIRSIHKGLNYYPKGSTAYVDVWDVVSIMTQLMERHIKNKRFIVIAENRTFKDFQEQLAKHLGVATAKKQATPLLLSLAWRMDWLNQKLFGKRRKLSKQMTKSISSNTKYDHSKIKDALDFEFTNLDRSIAKVGAYYLEDLKKAH